MILAIFDQQKRLFVGHFGVCWQVLVARKLDWIYARALRLFAKVATLVGLTRSDPQIKFNLKILSKFQNSLFVNYSPLF